MDKKKKLQIIALILLLLFLLFRGWSSFFGASDAKELVGHPWIERLPKDTRDQIRQVVFLEKAGQRAGAFGLSSAYRLELDLVGWSLEDDMLTVQFLQADQKRVFQARTWKCEGDAPVGLDLCLELRGADGETQRFFTRSDWVIDGDSSPAEALDVTKLLAR